jgi:uncharacterized repeat protein (TIGR03803 family)
MISLYPPKLICLLFLAVTATLASAQTFTSLVSFDAGNGDNPFAPLVIGADGNFYGTTASENGVGYGTVFKMTPEGALTTLYNFCSQINCTDGSYPIGGLTLASEGNFYGMTDSGGAFNFGTVFRITPSGELTTLYNFCSQTNCTDGRYPSAGLMQAANGNLYGMTAYGGLTGYGTVFEITLGGTLTTLHNFCLLPNCVDGAIPFGNLVQAPDGTFFGTTVSGGTHNYAGTAFRMSPSGNLKVIYSFCAKANCEDGSYVSAGLVLASGGNLYGTTAQGGYSFTKCNGSGCGTAFRITPSGKLTTLHSFCSKTCLDGAGPYSGVIQASDGNLYGVTGFGGAFCRNFSYRGCGTVFRITGTGEFTVLHSFNSIEGARPLGGLVQGSDSTLYGTTLEGGSSSACYGGCGTIFRLSSAAPATEYH